VATTDARLAASAIRALVRSGVRCAILHGHERLLGAEAESGGDADLVIDRPSLHALTAARGELMSAGLLPVLHLPYDAGGTGIIFLSDDLGKRGVQLDLLFDPRGRGRFRLSSTKLLEYRRPCRDAYVLAPEARVVYLWRKRSTKQQTVLLRGVRDQAMQLDHSVLRRCAVDLLGQPSVADDILAGRPAKRPRAVARTMFLHSARVASRLWRPTGFWLHVTDGSQSAAVSLRDRLSELLPYVTAIPGPRGLADMPRFISRFGTSRMRPGLIITIQGQLPLPGLRPDAISSLAHTSENETAQRLVSALAARCP
jgi:hypothetical protein